MQKRANILQRGQATLELVVCMVGLLTVTLGIICVGGLSISGVKVLREARQNAELNAHNGGNGGQGSEISTWHYGSDDVPFSVDDTPGTTDANTLEVSYFSDGSASAAESGNNAGYEFQALSEAGYFYHNDRNFTRDLSSSGYLAANLVSGKGNHGDEVYTLENTAHGGTMKFNGADAETFKRMFGALVGRNIGSTDLAEKRVNTVYFPASGL